MLNFVGLDDYIKLLLRFRGSINMKFIDLNMNER